jgi:transcriptional regulator with XRE-family HTH domain
MSRPVARGPRATPASRFGASLAHERRRRCLSMSELARIAGTHVSEISRLERGLRDPRLSTIVRLARALEVPLGQLLDRIAPAAP